MASVSMRVIWYLVVVLKFCDSVSDVTYPVTLKKTIKSNFNCTVYEQSLQKVLNRKKRWFVFPKGANALLTMVVTKTIIDGRPRGLQESMEVEMAFSLPPLVEGWRPVPLLTNKNNSVKSTVIGNQGVIIAQPKIDTSSDFVNNIWDHHQAHSNSNNRKPLTNYRQQHKNHPYRYLRRHPTILSKSSTRYKINKESRLHPWDHHREYRERRQIFENFERLGKYLEINIKSCILRAICEVKNSLLPEGESFIQDVARIVFTIPMDHQFEDDYADSARDQEINCARKFLVSCPFNPIEYFLQNGPRA